MKIRCRSRRTSSSTARQSTASQSTTSPSGPFTETLSNLPIGSSVSVHLFFTGSPDPRQLPFGPGNTPVSDQLCGSFRGGAGHAVPGFLLPFRLSAFASWVILRPLESCASHGRPTGVDLPDPNGVVVLHMSKTEPGRAPS